MKLATILLMMVLVSPLLGVEREKHNYIPEDGYVPTKEVAITIAVAVWEPIYGKDRIEKQKPFIATLDKDVWTVRGTLHTALGGVVEAEISKTDGRISRVSQGK